MLVATAVSPQLASDNIAINQNDIMQPGISQQLMSAPKSPLPKQKIPTPELPPIFHHIAFCESRDRQFDEDGEVLRGVANPADVGRYQINTVVWFDEAKKLGHDIMTEDGNEAMTLHIYKKYGTKPWRSSQKCWDRQDQAYAGNK